VIIQEAPQHCGVGAEIAAQLATHGLLDLVAPIQRVAGYDTVMPYYQLEPYYMPSVKRIMQAVEHVMEYE
jgi:pyruvate dehydrogenase E1 component beta subunit